MKPNFAIRTGIAASVIAHLSALALVLFLSEVHPFGSVTAEPIAVDLVTPAEVPPEPKKEEPKPKPDPSDAFNFNLQSSPPAAAAAPPAPAPAQQQASLSTPAPVNAKPGNARPQPPAASPTSGYAPPQPDLSLKYHVMLGLPPDLPPASPSDKPGDDFDSAASKAADIESSLVTEFRDHLKTCSKLPESIARSDKLRITLRVRMALDGRLAADPILIEASASAKGPALMQGAVAALEACQPYAMLPADRYGEWKVIDLSFTPQDFSG
jgi:hypothetical protein